MRRWCRPLAAGIALGLGLALSAAPAHGRGDARFPDPSGIPLEGSVSLLLGPDGHVHAWRYGAGGLGPLPETLSRIDQIPVNDLAISDDGRSCIVLPAVTLASNPNGKAAKGTRRARAEGLALLISSEADAASPRIAREIPFDGEGRRVVLSPDGRRAFVVSVRTAAGASPSQERAWIHELDLDSGRVAASDHLENPPSDLAIDPAGTRIYLAYPGRIVSYTTRPLAMSWHYRSPGENRAIGFRPGSQILYAVRKKEIILFDPVILAARPPEERRMHEDEATGTIPVPFDPLSLMFGRAGRFAMVDGDGNSWASIDLEAGRVFATGSGPAFGTNRSPVRLTPFRDLWGNLAMATFPEGTVVAVTAPEAPPVPEPTPAPSPTPSPSPTPRPFPSPSPTPTPPLPGPIPPEPPAPEPSPPPPMPSPSPPPPMPSPTPHPIPSPTPHPIPPSEAGSGLTGRITGRTELVVAVVIYGPDSIIRESARVAPQADGSWSAPLPAPGSYRVVPVAQGARPLRAEPHFQTIQIGGEAMGGIDFRILGTD